MMLIGLIVLALYLPTCFLCGYIIFSPLQSLVRKPPAQRKYMMSDMLAFFFPFQFGFIGLNFFFPDTQWDYRASAISIFIILIISVISWFYGIRILWRAEMIDWKRRIALLGVLMPTGFVISAIAFPAAVSSSDWIGIAIRSAIFAAIVFSLRRLAIWFMEGTVDENSVAEARLSIETKI
ncbi:MAG: hypothetical protein AAF623_18090 [Planctomycetota bacterium]